MRRIVVLLVALLMGLAGCLGDDGDGDGGSDGNGTGDGGDGGGGDGGDGGGEPRENVTVDITWSGVYNINGEYSTDTITVPANSTVTLTFTNEDPAVGHDFVVEGIQGASTVVLEACTPNMSECPSETVIFNVGAAQETKFFCSVGDHRSNDMEGDFIVE